MACGKNGTQTRTRKVSYITGRLEANCEELSIGVHDQLITENANFGIG